MTDKENFKAEIEKAYNEAQNRVKLVKDEYWEGKADAYRNVLCIFDSIQEEYNITGIKSRHATGKLKECIDNQTKEGLEQARKQLEENPQECMYTKDNYTNEDRKVLCDGCEEKCEYAQKKADWLQELQDKLDSLSKEDLEKVWAKYHQKEEPVSEDLEEAIDYYLNNGMALRLDWKQCDITFKASKLIKFASYIAQWQKEQITKNAIDATVKVDAGGYPYIDATIELYDYDKDEPLAKAGDKVKILVIKD